MKNVNTAESELDNEEIPQLQIVAAKNGAQNKRSLLPPLVLPSRLHARKPRPELASLGWKNRAVRLAAKSQV